MWNRQDNEPTVYEGGVTEYVGAGRAGRMEPDATVLDQRRSWTEQITEQSQAVRGPADNPYRGAFTPEAERLLPALLQAGVGGPITVDELLEAVLLIRRTQRMPQPAPAPQMPVYPVQPSMWNPPARMEPVPMGGSPTAVDTAPIPGMGRTACLRLAEGANELLPRVIPVELPYGGTLTIGRFDVSVGHKQSGFEFDKKTKAVSRRHAMIERQRDGGYVLSDRGSRAGTFVNGQRLQPNVPCRLQRGDRVSFGNGGADYLWEE